MSDSTERAAVEWLETGGRTWQLARRLRIGTPRTRRILLRLEKQGIARRCPRLSSVNDTYWLRGDHINGDSDHE